MSETAILWLFGTVIGLQTTVIGALVAAIWTHSNDCRDFRTQLAANVADIKSKIDRMDRDIGTHDTGMRGDIHALRSEVTPFVVRMQMIEEERKRDRGRLQRIEDEHDHDRKGRPPR